jgi:hypothetical protein
VQEYRRAGKLACHPAVAKGGIPGGKVSKEKARSAGDSHRRERPTSEILESLAASSQPSVTVGDVFGAMRTRAHGIALILFALPEAVPLPIPSLSLVLGIPLVLVAAHLILFGEGSGLPRRATSAKIPTSGVRALARFAVPVLRTLEFMTTPRWRTIADHQRAIGVVCLYLSLVLLAPFPFVNFAPALCLIGIALGMVQRDGAVIAIGVAATIVLTVTIGFAADWMAGFIGGSG